MGYTEVDLAELCGIHAGDGWLGSGTYEVGYGTSIKEEAYFQRVFNLYDKVFDFKRNAKYRILRRGAPYNSIELRIASKQIQNFLIKLGFPKGEKLRKLRIPKCAYKNVETMRAFLRGLNDTDGTLHWRKSVNNFYLIISWLTASEPFAFQVKTLLEKLGYRPSIYFRHQRSNNGMGGLGTWCVSIHRKGDVKHYLMQISFRNETRIKQFSKKRDIFLEHYVGPERFELSASTFFKTL